MKASKGRFALAVLSAIITCLVAGLSFASTSLPVAITSAVLETLGFGPIQSDLSNFVALLLTPTAIYFIYRFGTFAIEKWEAPPRVSEVMLEERYLANNLQALAFENAKLILRRQDDPKASDALSNWRDRVPETPKPIETEWLLRDMLVSVVNEIDLPEYGWRDEGKFWIGTKAGIRSQDSSPIIALVSDRAPDEKDLEGRLAFIEEKHGDISGYKIYSLHESDGDRLPIAGNHVSIGGVPVEIYTSRRLILDGLNLRGYATQIIRSFEETRVGGTTATLENSYVDLLVTGPGDDTAPLSRRLAEWADSDSNGHLALTGEYGQGKSTALLKFCYDWAKEFEATGSLGRRVPLLIELRGRNPSETDPLEFISAWCVRYRLEPRQVLNLIKSGDAIVIFEGFDELRNAGRAFYRHQHFSALWKFAFPGTKLVFSGRPNFFLDQEEANRTLRSNEARAITGGAYTEVWRLLKLDENQIKAACRSYEKAVGDGIADALAESPEFLDIVSRPSMLPVVATIWHDISALREGEAPLTSAVLIEKYIQAVFSRKEAELEQDLVVRHAPPGSRYLVVPKEVRELLTICVAWRMSGLGAKNTIPRSEIVNMVREIYDALITMAKSEGVAADIADGITQFEARMSDESIADRVEALATEICSAGLLVEDPVGGASNLRFPHKQFFEFLMAKAIGIVSDPRQFHATRIILQSSKEKRFLTRLSGEINSVYYLVDVVGQNLERVITKFERISIATYILNALFYFNTIGVMRRLTRNQNNSSGSENISQISFSSSGEANLDIVTKRISRSYNILSFSLVGYFALISPVIAIFLLNSSDSIHEYSPILLVIAAAFSITAIFFLYSVNSNFSGFYGSSGHEVVLHFLLSHWFRVKNYPKDGDQLAHLCILSLLRGKVLYPEGGECTLDAIPELIYPAPHFGWTGD